MSVAENFVVLNMIEIWPKYLGGLKNEKRASIIIIAPILLKLKNSIL